MMLKKTFSTLHAGRVAATLGILCGLPSTGVFQYPPCGSSRCNTSFSWLSCHHSTFSTLHAGRVAATLRGYADRPLPVNTFSTLHAGRVAATKQTWYRVDVT